MYNWVVEHNFEHDIILLFVKYTLYSEFQFSTGYCHFLKHNCSLLNAYLVVLFLVDYDELSIVLRNLYHYELYNKNELIGEHI